jgi:hypothetical protein
MDAQAYPASLAAGHHDPYMFDSTHFENLLTENSTRLFVPDDQLQIKIVEVGHRGRYLAMRQEPWEFLVRDPGILSRLRIAHQISSSRV